MTPEPVTRTVSTIDEPTRDASVVDDHRWLLPPQIRTAADAQRSSRAGERSFVVDWQLRDQAMP